MLEFTDQEIVSLKEWERKLLRFLFRGFHEASGAFSDGSVTRDEMKNIGSLNTKKYIIPYAFCPKGMEIMAELMKRPANQRPTARNLIEGHIFNCAGPEEDWPVWGPTPFSSWTPDLHTALIFARLKWDTDADNKPVNFSLRQNPHIAVLDTHMLFRHAETRDVQVFHTKALAEVFSEPDWKVHTEYLVYGKIHGPAHQVVCTRQFQGVGELKGSCWWKPERGPLAAEHIYRHDLTGDEVLKAKMVGDLFKAVGEERPDRTIGIMAAELARLQWDTALPDPYPEPIGLDLSWESHDIDLVLAIMAKELDGLGQLELWRRILVNPRQCTATLPNVGMMLNMLVDVESRVSSRRSSTASEKKKRKDPNRVSKPTRKISVARKIREDAG